MTAAVRHRGPDAMGQYDGDGASLGQARLSIIDLSTGDQPMKNEDGSLWVTYNGEIYNFPELKEELIEKGHKFVTTSDTEVLLHGYEEFGTDFFRRLDGIFAFALWEEREKRLILVRDYFGIKPLHYHYDGATIRFGSEVKAILADQRVDRRVDKQALHYFLNLRFIPGERTLLQGIRRLSAGHFLVFQNQAVTVERYYRLEPESHGKKSEDYYVEGIRERLDRAVKKQMISDVPLGVYLSGGMDSSSLVAFMSKYSSGFKTFSLGFNEPTDELSDAKVVADRFGTEHHEMSLDPEPLKQYPEVIWYAEEPKENILQGYLLAKFARQYVKVVQGGLGGDELFAGYVINRFVHPTDHIQGLVPGWLQKGVMAKMSRLAYGLQSRTGLLATDEYRRGIQLLLAMGDPVKYYSILRNVWDHDPGAGQTFYGPQMRAFDAAPVRDALSPYFIGQGRTPTEKVLWAEFHAKMQDDFLENEDRTSMAHGLEVRVPFLDRDLVRFCMGIPASLHIKRNETKHLLKMAMEPFLPEYTLNKKKWGFTFNPYFQFQKDLKGAAQKILTPERVSQRGWFDYAYLKRIMDHKPHPRLRWHYFFLWLAMGLEIWARMFLDGDAARPILDLEDHFA